MHSSCRRHDCRHGQDHQCIKHAWTDLELVVSHTGSGDEFDQAADPHPVVVGRRAWMFFDGEKNPAAQCHVMAVTAPAVPKGLSINVN